MQSRWLWRPRFGAALTTGPVACGLYGHREFQNFSAVGEAVDLSDRLCALNSVYGSQVLLASRTHSLIRDYVEVRPLEAVVTPRNRQSTEVYELLGLRGDLDEADERAREAFARAISHLRKGEKTEARALLAEAVIPGRDDPVPRYFLERAQDTRKEAQEPADNPAKLARLLSAV